MLRWLGFSSHIGFALGTCPSNVARYSLQDGFDYGEANHGFASSWFVGHAYGLQIVIFSAHSNRKIDYDGSVTIRMAISWTFL